MKSKMVLRFILVILLNLYTVQAKRSQLNKQQYNNLSNAIITKPYHQLLTSSLPSSSSSSVYSTDSFNEKESKILHNNVEVNGDGTYHYNFETSNGIKRIEKGAIDGTIQGSSSYISPEGIEIKIAYVADENGFHPIGNHIPQVPDYIVRALEYIRNHPYIEKDYYTGEVKQTSFSSKKPLNSIISPTTTKRSFFTTNNISHKLKNNIRH